MGIEASQFSELITLESSSGDELMLAPRSIASIQAGLELINNKFLKADLTAYAQIRDLSDRSKVNTDELREMVANDYIVRSETYLTTEEERKYDAGSLVDKYIKKR